MKLYIKLLEFLSRSNIKSYLLWVVGAYYAENFIRNGYRKFDPEGFWGSAFLETWGFPLWFMYFIGVLEFVGGLFLLVPKLRPHASMVLAVVMFGAIATKSIHATGIAAENTYNFILDLLFLIGTIAILLFFASYQNHLLKPKTIEQE